MKTAIYWPVHLGPLGKQADLWSVVNLLLETLTDEGIELFVDSDPAQPALQRLFQEIRTGRVNRLIFRSTADLCMTFEELTKFLTMLTRSRVRVEQICDILPGVLFRDRPESLGRFRHRQRVAKVTRLRRLGLTISEIGSLTRSTPQQVYRIMSRPR